MGPTARVAADPSASNGTAGDGEPNWTDDQLAELEERKLAFIDQIQSLGHDKRLFSSVSAGDVLAENVLGPHSLASFATEWRAYPMTTWGATAKGPTTVRAEELGYTKEMAGFEGDRRMERVNPELTDGAYYGPSRGHLQPRWARHVGMPRGYGYGASMGAWILDYVAAWAGEWGTVTHSSAQYRNPALTGDATFISGQVVDTRVERKRVHIAVGEGRDAQPGRRQDGHGHRRGRASGRVGAEGAPGAPPSRDQGRRSGGSALAASCSACWGNHSPAPGSTIPHSGSTVSPAGPSPRVHSPSDSPGVLTHR